MSNTIDERVVKMQFDNASFEKNVQTSLGTLANLKNALNFGKVDFSGLASNIEKITNKVTGMGGIWDTVCNRMVNLAVDTGQKIAKAFVFDPPSDGFKEYELKMNSLKVIMESSHAPLETVNKYLNELNTYSDQTIYSFSDMTASIGKFTNAGVELGSAVNAIKGIANEAALAGASTQQASHAMYNFAQALSAGSVKLIDWKSIENANMATVEFKDTLLETAVALGTVTKEGDKYVSTTTNAQGKVSAAFDATQGFNDSLQAQWMTTDVLTTALEAYATDVTKMTAAEKEAYEEKLKGLGYTDEQITKLEDLGSRATKAATEVRTFSAMMDALKEAVGSGWAQTWELIFGNMEEATELWTNINDVLSGFIGNFSDARNAVLQDWKDLGGRTKLIEGLANVFHILGNVIQPIKDAFSLVFPPFTGKNLADITNKFAEFTGKIRSATEFFPMKLFGAEEVKNTNAVGQAVKEIADEKGISEKVEEIHKGAEQTAKDWTKIRDIAKDVINGDYGNDSARKDALKKAGFDPEEIQAYVDKVHELSNGTWDLSDKTLEAVEKSLGAVEKSEEGVSKAAQTAEEAQKATAQATDDVTKSVDKTADAYSKAEANAQRTMNAWYDKTMDITEAGNLLTFSIANAMSGVINIFKSAGQVLGVFGKAWKDSFSGVEVTMGHLIALDEAMGNFADKMIISEDALDSFYSAFKNIFSVVKSVRDNIIKTAITVFPVVLDFMSSVISAGGNVIRFLSSTIGLVANVISRSRIISKVFGALSFVIKEVGSALSFVVKTIGYFAGLLSKAVSYVDDYISRFHTMEIAGIRLDAALTRIADAYEKLKQKLGEKLGFSSFDEFAKKADKVVDKIKKVLVPAFDGLMTGVLGKRKSKKDDGILSSIIPLKKEEKSVSKIINFFDTARETINNAVSGVIDKINSNKKKQTGISGIFDFSSLNKSTKNTGKPLESVVESVKKVKDSLAKVNIGETFKKTFEFLRDKAIPNAIDFVCDAFGKFEMFIAKLDFKKVLLAAKTVRTIVKIFNGIKLAKSFSGMADSIGGFFDKLGGRFGGKEESKATSFLKIAASIALVAKAISLIADIPADRLDSSVGVVAGIAAVMSAIVVAFSKIKVGKEADLAGATKAATGMAVALYIIAKSIALIAKIPANQLKAAKGVIFVTVAVLTAATFALSKMKAVPKSSILAPVGFAVALYILAGALAKIGKIPEDQLKQAEKSLIKIGVALAIAMHVIGWGDYNAASVFAPLAFAIALYMLGMELVALSLIPVNRLIKGGIVVKFIETLLKSAMKSLEGVDSKAVVGPLAFAAGVYLIGRTVAKLGKMDVGSLAKGVVAVGFIGLILVGCMKLLRMATEGSTIDKSVLVGLVVVAGSIMLLGTAMSGLGKLPFGQILKGAVAIGAIGAILSGIMYLLSKYTGHIDTSVIGTMVVATGMIVTLAITAALIGLAPLGNLVKGIVVIGAVGTILALVVTFLDNVKINPSTIFTLVVATISIVTLASTAALIGLVPLGNLAKGVGVIFAVAAILSAVTVILSVTKVSPANIFAMIATVVAIAALAAVSVAIGVIPTAILKKGVSVVIILGLLLAVISHELGSVKISISNIVALIAIVGSIQLLAFSVLSLGVLPLTVLGKGLAVITLLSVLLTAMTNVLGKGNFGVLDIAAPLVLVGSILALAYAVVKIGSVETGTLKKGTIVIGLIMAALVLALKELSKISGQLAILTVAAPGLLAFAGVINILSSIVVMLGGLTVGNLGKGLVGLVGVVGTMVVAFKLLATASPEIIMISAAFMLFGIAASFIGDAFIKVAAALLIFTQALMLFATLDSPEQFTGLAVGLTVLGGVLLVFIGLVVGLVAVLYTMPGLIPPLLAFGAAILMIGAGLYLLVSAIEKLIAIGGQLGPALVTAISSIASSAGQILSAIGDAISSALNYIVQNAPAFMEKAGALIGSAAEGISKNAPKIAAKVGDAIGKGLSWISKNLPKWLSAGGKLIANVASGIAKNAPKVASQVLSLMAKGLSSIKKNMPKWLSAGKELVGKLISGLLSLGGKLASSAGKLASNATSSIKKKVGEWRSIGRNMVSGLIGGIMSKAGEVASKAASLVSRAISAAKSKLDSHSPSRVFIKIGEDIDNGLMIGIDKKAGMAADRTGSLAERVIDAARGPMEHLADLFSGDIVTDPTITPVMDLSEIQNGTDQLYAMMNEADRFSFHGNVDLATETNRSVDADSRRKEESQASATNALIDAINGLTALIGNTGNVYNVNGVTYDDGSNVSTAVRSLIRAAKVEGRA